MIPIKNFCGKTPYLAKHASQIKKNAEIIKNFRMPVISLIAPKKHKKRK